MITAALQEDPPFGSESWDSAFGVPLSSSSDTAELADCDLNTRHQQASWAIGSAHPEPGE